MEKERERERERERKKKKEAQAGNELSNILPKILAREENATPIRLIRLQQ